MKTLVTTLVMMFSGVTASGGTYLVETSMSINAGAERGVHCLYSRNAEKKEFEIELTPDKKNPNFMRGTRQVPFGVIDQNGIEHVLNYQVVLSKTPGEPLNVALVLGKIDGSIKARKSLSEPLNSQEDDFSLEYETSPNCYTNQKMYLLNVTEK